MKKRILIIAIAVLVVIAIGVGIYLALRKTPVYNLPVTLATPEVQLNEDLTVQWSAVEGAESYLISINGSDMRTTTGLSYPAIAAPGEYTIGVLALGGNGRSERSKTVSYTIYAVELPENELYTVTGDRSVGQNQNYSFSVKIGEGCSQSTPVVKVNGKEVIADNGVYSVDHVTENLSVAVEGVELNRLNVTLPSGVGYSVDGEAYALYGKDYTFALNLQNMYDRSHAEVKVNGEILEGDNGKYTVENVTAAVEITVTGVTVNSYQVQLNMGRGYTITPAGKQSVSYGKSLSFTVTADDPSYGLTVKLNNKVLPGQNGQYTISDIVSDMAVTVDVSGLPELTVVDRLLESDSWKAAVRDANGKTLTAAANPTLRGSYLKRLWDAGYTHMVFTAKLDTDGAFIHGSDNIYRFWNAFAAGVENDVRVDLNEFHDGDTWYDLVFCNMTGGNVTISNPRAYKSAETLAWTKSNTNIYFANEDGYYVLDTKAGMQQVTSTAQWKEKYNIGTAWLVYTDYLAPGNNYRSVLVGYEGPINHLLDGTEGGWSVMGGFDGGQVFSLTNESGGISRFKIADFVSNYTTGSMTYVDENTFAFNSVGQYQTYTLVTTQDLIAQGYTKLKVTLTGSLNNGALLWYGPSAGVYGIDGSAFVGGQYTFEVDLSTMGTDKYFTIMTSGNSAENPITMQVNVEKIGEGNPLVYHTVTFPAGKGYTVNGENRVIDGTAYGFTVTLHEGYDPATLKVMANGQALSPVNGRYLIEEVKSDITITVSDPELYTYQVTAPVGEGFTFDGEATVTYGEDYVFRVAPVKAGDNLLVTVNGQTVSPVEGRYTVEAVKENLQITVECLTNKYIVVIPTGNGYSVTPSGDQQVEYGESLRFTVIPNGTDATVVVKANGTTVTGVDGVYVLTDIRENITVTISVTSPLNALLSADSWSSGGTADNGTLAVPANSTLKASALKTLWDAGYTHMVFTAKLDTDGAFIHGSDNIYRFWNAFAAGVENDVRVDLNEFHDGDTWYDLIFCNMTGGNITISNPRGFKSAETLTWTKSATNIYFANEDGYYVLDTKASWQQVTSTAQWKEKYNIGTAWLVYTDYLVPGSNYRSVLVGYEGPINHLIDGTEGGWSVMGGFDGGQVFSLTNESGGISRFKIADFVSNYTTGSMTYVDENTFTFNSVGQYQTYTLVTTQDLIAQGYTKLKVTLTGSLNNGALLWYGPSAGVYGIDGSAFVGGQYTFEVDLSTMGTDKYFTIMTSGNSVANPIIMQVKIEPVKE